MALGFGIRFSELGIIGFWSGIYLPRQSLGTEKVKLHKRSTSKGKATITFIASTG